MGKFKLIFSILFLLLMSVGCASASTINDGSCVMAYYFNNDSSTIYDTSGNNNHGTPYNLTHNTQYNGAVNLSLNGSYSYISIDSPTALNLTSFTICVGLKMHNTTATQGIMAKNYNVWGDTSYVAWVQDGRYSLDVNTSGSGLNRVYYAIQNTNYHDIAFLYDASAPYQTIYYDGSDVAISGTTKIPAGTIYDSKQTPILGTHVRNQMKYYLNGDIAYIEVYNRALTAAEINTIKNANRWRTEGQYVKFNDSSVTLNASSPVFNATVSLSSVLPTNTKVSYSAVNGTGLNGVDFTVSPSPGRITFAGDSITYNMDHNSNTFISTVRSDLTGWDTSEVGNPGYTTSQILSMYLSRVAILYPDYVSVLAGTNDLLQGSFTAETIENNLYTYWTMAQNDGCTVIACTIPPCGLVATESRRVAVNEWIRSNATENNIHLLDLDVILRDPDDQDSLLAEYTTDNIHLTNAGYQAWYDALNTSWFEPVNYITFDSGETSKNISVSVSNLATSKNFSILLTDPKNVGINEDTASINISTSGYADFTAQSLAGNAPFSTKFAHSNTNTVACYWDFENDGTIDSIKQNPVHTYGQAGTYSVNLTVHNGYGNFSTVKTDYITVSTPPFASDPTTWINWIWSYLRVSMWVAA